MTIYVGTTNTDGTGSAQNLNADNGFSPTLEELYGPPPDMPVQDGTWAYGYIDESLSLVETTIKSCVYCFSYRTNAENIAQWNAQNLKEIAMLDVEDGRVDISNFVDVCFINNAYGQRYESEFDGHQRLSITDAKRGFIDTRNLDGNPRDYGSEPFDGYHYGDTTSSWANITIKPHSNGDSWSNLFEVYTGYAEDIVTFTADENGDRDSSTQWTEFNVDLGEDNDLFYYDLAHSVNDDQRRIVDGGSGDDMLFLRVDTDDLAFEHFELITSNQNQLFLNSTLLADNASDTGLIIHNTTVQFSSDITDIAINPLNQAQQEYVSSTSNWQQYGSNYRALTLDSDDFVAVTVSTAEDSYTLLMNTADDLVPI